MPPSLPPIKVLVLGSGGREHALAWSLAQSSRVTEVLVLPGNGGTSTLPKTRNVTNVSATDFIALTRFAKEEGVGLVVPGPEQPLVDGVADACRAVGIPCFGPSAAAARIEGSKAFCKDFMARHNIPTASYATFTDYDKACAYVNQVDHPVVVKTSGLAAGKGVLLPTSKEEALEAVRSMMVDHVFGDAGKEVVIEEMLTGPEISVLALSDGYTVIPLPAAQDHKRIYDQDQGPNTGGMGCYAPAPVATPEVMREIKEKILEPAVRGMRLDGHPFVGCLFAGLMITPKGGVKTLEFNCRFGDPETEVVLPLIDGDLSVILQAAAEQWLDGASIRILEGRSAATVVASAKGYPGSYPKGTPIHLQDPLPDSTLIFHAGTKVSSDQALVTSGGRVLMATGWGKDLKSAVQGAYSAMECVNFEGMHYRRDIAYQALNAPSSPSSSEVMTYAGAGVSIDRGNELVEGIRQLVRSTRRPGADAEIGGFGGVFDLATAFPQAGTRPEDPLLVAATDGVGTKLVIAQQAGIHRTIGVDLVAMSVNDLVVQGAEPLLFLDYFACGALEVGVARDVVEGVAKGCRDAGCALVGGETAEMPGLYGDGEYDVAGFAVGMVDRPKVLPLLGEMKEGDTLLGLASSGPHSNGYSLIRRIVHKAFGSEGGLVDWQGTPAPFPTTTQGGSGGESLGEALLSPTRIYVKSLLHALRSLPHGDIKGLSHITGGGFQENVPRMLPDHLAAQVNVGSWTLPPVFQWLKSTGNVPAEELARTFNCGIGMVLVVKADQATKVTQVLQEAGEVVYQIGQLVPRASGPGCILEGLSQHW
ncbi:MAG: phosphoribosylformylglycinamidine cyclo-ligase [Piptocephalis tieghemiana]|nr:MAG: phosphoribosylformylglycinamidine cyclo-ligase [Piptocephalis tieghemiana]